MKVRKRTAGHKVPTRGPTPPKKGVRKAPARAQSTRSGHAASAPEGKEREASASPGPAARQGQGRSAQGRGAQGVTGRTKKPMASLRKPSAPRSVDASVSSGGRAAAERPRKSLSIVARKDGSERRRTTVYFEPELARRLNVYCAQHDLEMSLVVGEAVEAYLRSKKA